MKSIHRGRKFWIGLATTGMFACEIALAVSGRPEAQSQTGLLQHVPPTTSVPSPSPLNHPVTERSEDNQLAKKPRRAAISEFDNHAQAAAKVFKHPTQPGGK